ncbi:hypothetical protein Tco_0168575 [Tanacetum coccineum]
MAIASTTVVVLGFIRVEGFEVPDTASTSNEPPEAAGPTKDDMEGLFEMANEELFPACTWMSSLDFLAKFAHLKVLYKWTDTSFDDTMEFLLKAFPTGAKIPKTYYEAKKKTKMSKFVQLAKRVDGKTKTPRERKFLQGVTLLHLFPRLKRMSWIITHCQALTLDMYWILYEDESSFMLTCLIPGPKSPGKDMDVYLQPLVKELKTLWKKAGVKTLDVATNTEFSMRAMHFIRLFSDFYPPFFVCYPVGVRNDKTFNGKSDNRPKPKKLTSARIIQQLVDLPSRIPGKHPSYGGVKRPRDPIVERNWSKRSIFYKLPYWSSLPLKHNLDVMHIEKNVLESILGTLLMNDKSKDTNKARQDLEQLNIRPELWLSKKGNGKFIKPHAAYSFPPEKRRKFCKFIKDNLEDWFITRLSRSGSIRRSSDSEERLVAREEKKGSESALITKMRLGRTLIYLIELYKKTHQKEGKWAKDVFEARYRSRGSTKYLYSGLLLASTQVDIASLSHIVPPLLITVPKLTIRKAEWNDRSILVSHIKRLGQAGGWEWGGGGGGGGG